VRMRKGKSERGKEKGAETRKVTQKEDGGFRLCPVALRKRGRNSSGKERKESKSGKTKTFSRSSQSKEASAASLFNHREKKKVIEREKGGGVRMKKKKLKGPRGANKREKGAGFVLKEGVGRLKKEGTRKGKANLSLSIGKKDGKLKTPPRSRERRGNIEKGV